MFPGMSHFIGWLCVALDFLVNLREKVTKRSRMRSKVEKISHTIVQSNCLTLGTQSSASLRVRRF